MEIRTDIKTNVSDLKSLDIINKYWKLNNDWELIYSESNLAKEYNMNIVELRSFCQDNSFLSIVVSACYLCGEELAGTAHSRDELLIRLGDLNSQDLKDEDVICPNCMKKNIEWFEKVYFSQKLPEKEQEAKINQLQKLLKEKAWNQLQEDEKEIIRRFILSRNAHEIYNDAFNYYIMEMKEQEINNGRLKLPSFRISDALYLVHIKF